MTSMLSRVDRRGVAHVRREPRELSDLLGGDLALHAPQRHVRSKGPPLDVVAEGLTRDLEIVMEKLELGIVTDAHPEDSRCAQVRERTDTAHVKTQRLEASRDRGQRIAHRPRGVGTLLAKEFHRDVDTLRRHPRYGPRRLSKGRGRVVNRLPLGFRKINRDEQPHGDGRRRRLRAPGG